MKLLLLSISLTLISISLHAQSTHNSLLVIGSEAPPIIVAKWLKGTPVLRFEKGKVYAIELTNRYCAPCRASIPRLSAISKKFLDQVIVVSVFVGENKRDSLGTSYINAVTQYVNGFGNKMDFRIAVDDPSQTMFDTWTYAAKGAYGYPYLFLVDQRGIIAWIGDPLDNQLSEIIKELMLGQFNPDSAEEWHQKETVIYKKMDNAINNSEYQIALKIVDSLINKNPYKTQLYGKKFDILLQMDEKKAYRFAHGNIHNPNFDESVLLGMCNQIRYRSQDTKQLKNTDWDLAIALAEQAFKLNSGSSKELLFSTFSAEASIYAAKGDYKKAIEAKRRALLYLEKFNKDDEEIKKYEKLALAEYKRKSAEASRRK